MVFCCWAAVYSGIRVNASVLFWKKVHAKFSFFIQFSHNARSTHTQRNCNHNIYGWIVDFANVNAQTKVNWMVNYFAFFVDFAFYLCVRVCDSTRVCVLFMHRNHMSVGKRYIWVFFHSIARIRLLFCCCFLCVVDLISG